MGKLMNDWLERDNRSIRSEPAGTREGRYRAMVEALEQVAGQLDVGLKVARLAPLTDRTRILNDLHKCVRGMGLLLNEALSEYAVIARSDETSTALVRP